MELQDLCIVHFSGELKMWDRDYFSDETDEDFATRVLRDCSYKSAQLWLDKTAQDHFGGRSVHQRPRAGDVRLARGTEPCLWVGIGASAKRGPGVRRGRHCFYQLFGVAALAPRGLPPCRGFVREVPLAFPAPHLLAFGLWASMRYLVQVAGARRIRELGRCSCMERLAGFCAGGFAGCYWRFSVTSRSGAHSQDCVRTQLQQLVCSLLEMARRPPALCARSSSARWRAFGGLPDCAWV